MDNLDHLKQKLEQARSEVAELLRIREEQRTQLETIKEEITQLETGRGDRVIDAIRVGNQERVAWSESQTVIGKRTQLETVKDVLAALEPRIMAAKDWVLKCKAACFKAEADILNNQAKDRQSKTDKLLAQLREWEGVDYAPSLVMEVQSVNAATKLPRYNPYPTPGRSITGELRRKAGYYIDCADRILKGQSYFIDPMGDGNTVFPIPEYLGPASECQD